MTHTPRKRFGQNFLHDENILRNIIAAINPQPTQTIIEIGPGLGALTESLVTSGATLHAIEIDSDLCTELRDKYTQQNFHLHNQDALDLDLKDFDSSNKLRICGNLPYNISTPLLFQLLKNVSLIQDMHFLLQKEVVDRITSNPGCKNYGRLSVMLQYYCVTESLFNVSANCFYPVPAVTSAVVRLTPHLDIPHVANDFAQFAAIVKQAFSQRRKTVANACKKIINSAVWQQADIDGRRRAETLSVAEFVKLANIVSDQ
jgi:16S rRNA (adenine1518-N6/adenine1519-N6)-dimethyltransferase